MTIKSHTKMFKQLEAKPVILAKYKKHNEPKERKYGSLKKKCKRCGRMGAHISKYNLHLCRQCFRELAKAIGFKKYN